MKQSVVARKEAVLAGGLVACTFCYFLLFAQFAFLHRIELLDADKAWLQPVMLLMGLGGLLGSGFAWWLFSAERLRALLQSSFGVCALFAVAAGVLERLEFYLAIGLGVGVSLGALTVAVVPCLRLLLGSGRIGVVVGIGTGLAYFSSNVPWLFQQEAQVQCLVAGAVALLGFGFSLFLPRLWDVSRMEAKADELPFRFPIGWLVLLFFALVWLDSAAFYAIQETDEMRGLTWGEPSHLWGNAWVHLLFGALSGWALDKGWLRGVLAFAMALLVAGCVWLKLGYGDASWLGAGFYVAGVSLYSTGLVAVVAQRGDRQGWWRMAPAAAMLLGIAGWVGSGMGIGMARDLGTVPYAFLAVAAIVAAVALVGLGSAGERRAAS